MFSVFVHALLSLAPFLLRVSVAQSPPDPQGSPWFMGCVDAESGLYAPEGARDLDPVTCCARCLDEGYQVALVSEGCYCGNQQHGLVVSECFNTSSAGETKDGRGESERQSVPYLPYGGGRGSVALYRARGPFLHSVHLSASPDRVQAGKIFAVKVSGNLAGPPTQPTGLLDLRGQDLSYVTVEFQQMTPKGQSSHRVDVLDDGSFVVSSDWTVETPGIYELNVSVSNPISTLSTTLHLSVLQPSSDSLLVSVLHGPLGVPSCVSFPLTDSDHVTVEAAYLGDAVTLQAVMGDDPAVEFSWWFTHTEREKSTEGVKTACLFQSECLNSTVDWTFETEGVHVVSVNASGAYGWTQGTIHVVVVHPVSDLKVIISESQLTAGEGIFVDVGLSTTVKHLFVINLTLSTDTKDHFSNTAKDKNFNNSCDDDHSVNHNHSNISCHGGTHLCLHLHTSNLSSCHLHLHLHCLLPIAAGKYHLIASLPSTCDPPSVLRPVSLPRTLMVYECLCTLRESQSFTVSTHRELSVEVVSPASPMESRVMWTFSLDDVIVLSRTTETWYLNVSLSTAGHYKVTAEAFNPVGWASFCTHILVQEPVGELVLNAPSVVTTNQKHAVSFSVTGGSNVTVSLLANATLLYRNSSYTIGDEATAVLLFDHTGPVVVELRAENRVSSQSKSVRVCAEGNRKPSPHLRVTPAWKPPTSQISVHTLAGNVRVYAERQVYPTNTDITFLAVAEALDPTEFLWHFGDSGSVRTTSRNVTKRYHKPGSYDVVVVMSSGRTSVTSDVFPLVVQRVVKLNRLLHRPSVLQNHTVTVSCRVSAGTEVTFLWSFGDGSSRMGQSTEKHIFHTTGEFIVNVTVSNLVSSASLSSHIFVVDRPCQPPPVKNMGPLQLQVRRHEVVRLGVTYEADLDCDLSGGLQYTWTLFDSAGRALTLPLIETHRQSLTLPGHLLQYDTYTAVARVQVISSVVYSNYSVRVQVMPSPPVPFIEGGTNVFVNNNNNTVVTLDGQRSYDPDFPTNPVSFSWTCKPVSSIATSCFHHDVPTSSPVLTFPASYLKRNFDLFQFTLTIRSGERSASSEVFLTLASNTVSKVSVHCPQCQGDQVNWSQAFSVSALCEGRDVSLKDIQYTWRLYLVNASSKPVAEVPFCYTVDLSAPSAIKEDPSTSPQTPGTSTERPLTTDALSTSAPASKSENASRPRAETPYLKITDGGAPALTGMTEREPPSVSSLVNIRTAESAPEHLGHGHQYGKSTTREEPFYHPRGEFDPPEPLYSSTEYQTLALDNSGVLYSDHFAQSDVISEFPIDSDSSGDWEVSFPVLEGGDVGGHAVTDEDYDVPFISAEEGEPGISAGRPTGADGENFGPAGDSEFVSATHEDEGSNLVDSRPPVKIQDPVLLDLPRDLVDRGLFESYTSTGVSSSFLSFKPFALRPGNRYMLEVIAKSHDSLVGRSQLFLKTNPAPKGMMCQVQPVKGLELYTHFSVFCTSGKEDLLYEYSFSVGDKPPRVLYQGRDFQYYFSLPSGDPNDDYKVTVYTEIRSSTYGTATKLCPVTVRVQPSFFRNTSSSSSSSHVDPDLELWESGLRNLSDLVRLGNSAEIRNYVSLLSSILNRLSLDTEANVQAQRRTRTMLICTVCELESSEQASMVDSIHILKNLLQVTSQVTLASARQATAHVQAISKHFSGSSGPVNYFLDQDTLYNLMALLSHSLQAAISNRADIKQTSDPHEERIRNNIASSNGCIPDSSSGVYMKRSISTKQTLQLVADVLQTASDLMLRYIVLHGAQEHRVSTCLLALYATYQNQTSTVVSSGSATVSMPTSLIQFLFVHRHGEAESGPCVLSMLTELSPSLYAQPRYPGTVSGPVVDLSLYECTKRRKIPIRSLVEPINTELQLPPGNKSNGREYVLLRSQIHYHSFNLTREHLQQAIQLSVTFTPPPSKAFPIMLLFGMFERPTPSTHHLQRIHRWERNIAHFTLPPSYLSSAGVGYLALLDADFAKVPKRKHLSEQVSYSLTVGGSLCLSWDSHRGAWTHRGCRTQRADTTLAVSCSCHHLRPLTVVQQRIQTCHDSTDLDPFLSVSNDLTVLAVLVLCVCLYVPGLVVCKRADVTAEANGRVHYLSDNSPCDPYLYAVTVHTGVCSAAYMSAKVYIVLNGEDGSSQTRELQVPGCTLFRKNSQDTFILSAADSLGPVWGVHIWHDNSGPSLDWYLKQIEVSEVNRGHVKGRAWLFVGPCWLAASKGDGRVERMLRVCTQGMGFAKMLSLKLLDYLADHHIWISVLGCPRPSPFTHAQRLSVSLLLLSGYACVSAVVISQMDDWLPLELGIIDVSAVSVRTGALSVAAVLPAAAIISFLFRLREVKLMGSGVVKGETTERDFSEDALSLTDSIFEPHLSWSTLQQWAQEAWGKKYQDADLLPAPITTLENKKTDQENEIQKDTVMRKDGARAVANNTGPVLRNVLPISEGNNVNQAPRGKEFELLSESSRFQGAQNALLSGTRDGGHAAQRGKDAQGERKESSRQQAARLSHSSCHHVSNGPKRRGFGRVSQWCRYLAWTLCLLSSLSCLVLSAVLGMRFSNSKVLLWIHSFFFALVSCIFFIQPAVISTVAVSVSFWHRKRADFHTFSLIREFEIETSKLQSPNGANQPEEQFKTSSFPQERRTYLEKLLGARKRARHLRLVRPPTPAELKKARVKKRREALIHNTFRDLSVCGFMLFLMLCINYGSSFTEHYHLNKAVRKQFIRGHDDAFMSIQKHEDWWKWAETRLLHLIYKNSSVTTEFQQSHVLIGEPVLWRWDVFSSFQGHVFGMTLVPEGPRLSGGGSSTHPHSIVLVPMATPLSTCGHLGCYLEPSATLGLGYAKSDAASKLKLLRSDGWLGRQTAAMKVHITLFSPAANLFTSVTLLAEQRPTGVLLPSAKVQSVRVYHSPGVWDYFVMVCQLLFLLLSLLHLCDQIYTVGQQGLMGYWKTPRSWLEVTLLIVTLLYYVYYIYHSVIILEVVKVLQRHSNRGHVDVSLLAACEQHIRTLRGIMLFLLIMKCVTVLRVNRTLATSAKLFTCSLSSLFWPTISGFILMLALSCVGNLLFAQSSWAFSSFIRSLQTLLCHGWGLRAIRGLLLSGRDFIYGGVLSMSFTVVWTAVVIGVVSSLVRSAKRSQSRGNALTVAEVAGYVRHRISDFTGQRRQAWTENHVEGKTYYLEEFESLVDELLFRLNALSDSLHHTLPPKAHLYREEDSPVISPIQKPCDVDSQMEETIVCDYADENGENPLASHLPRSKIELGIWQILPQRGHQEDDPSSDTVVVLGNAQQPGTKVELNSKDRELMTHLKAQNYLSLPESASPIRVWTNDVLEKQVDQRTQTSNSCIIRKSQATHTEVVVEVLVHEEPWRQKF